MLAQEHSRKRISCEFWRDVGITNGGRCLLGRFGGCPSDGLCENHCVYSRDGRKAKHSAEQIAARRHSFFSYMASLGTYPEGQYKGRGIVMCAGGANLFALAWTNIQVLRELGCKLPVEVWHLGPDEMDAEMVAMLSACDAKVVDAFNYPDHPTQGWPLKPFAMLNCGFEEFMFLDADNFAVSDPTYLFDTPGYTKTGAVFWPDISVLADPRLARLFDLPDRIMDDPEQESGMLLVDKKRGWRGMNAAWAMNRNGEYEFFSQYMLGEKDAYRIGWLATKTPFHMIEFLPVRSQSDCLYQHDPLGRVIFEHRAGYYNKWNFAEGKMSADKMIQQKMIERHVESLVHLWDGVIHSDKGASNDDGN
jgi:alpha 1,2-mannosyltransferase